MSRTHRSKPVWTPRHQPTTGAERAYLNRKREAASLKPSVAEAFRLELPTSTALKLGRVRS